MEKHLYLLINLGVAGRRWSQGNLQGRPALHEVGDEGKCKCERHYGKMEDM